MSIRYDEYKNRVHFKGSTKREYVKNKTKESIDDLISNSQYGFSIDVYHEDEETYTTHDVAILSTKTTQEYEAANIIAHLETGLDKGTLFKWNDYDWIILKKMFRPDQPGFNGIAYRCTGYLKWIDEKTKKLHIQPAYIRSGRITNAVGVTPDVNRYYDNIVLHDTDWNMVAATQQPPVETRFHPEMRFIIKGQAYRVTNVDNVSIDNVSILSLSDDHVLDTDDLINDIAYSDVYDYTIKPTYGTEMSVYAGDIMELPMTIMNHGKEIKEEYILTSLNPEIIEINKHQIISRGLGTAVVEAHLKLNPMIKTQVIITVGAEHSNPEPELFIQGQDHIEWNSTEEYYLSNGKPVNITADVQSKVKYTCETIYREDDIVGLRISIKDKYAGTIELTCETEQGTINKTVYIRTV